MRQPAKPKPQAFEEVARVLKIYDWLEEEMGRRQPAMIVSSEPPLTATVKISDIKWLPPKVTGDAILAVAERIAARTEG